MSLISTPSLISKWRHYSGRHGAVHALLSYFGRKIPGVWPVIGRAVTRRYLERWLSTQGVKLVNLGSGSNLIVEMLNADRSPHADVFVDITERLPFPSGSLDGILCEEVIEHLDYLAAIGLRDEILRVLKPGGIIRISTPDLSYLLRMAVSAVAPERMVRAEAETFLGGVPLGPATLRLGAINSFFYHHGHRCLYNLDGLVELFQAGGFEVYRISSYGDPQSRLGTYDSHAERYGHPADVSLFIEFVRPAACES